MVNFYFENESQLEKNQWGISEPVSGEQTPTEKIDLVIVPLLAFDKKGNRVGYGKGFYDPFSSASVSLVLSSITLSVVVAQLFWI